MGGITRVVQTGIGLVAELKVASKEHKSMKATTEEVSDVQSKQLPTLKYQLQIEGTEERDEEDDAADDEEFTNSAPPLYPSDSLPSALDEESPPPYTDEELVNVNDTKYSPPSVNFVPTRMKCPVIIPQRRPGSKTRGFVRAYAPALANHGIDQDTFLTFLKSFHKASQASPILTAITMGAQSLGNIPEPGSMLAGIGISVMSGAAENLQNRYRTNAYLDQANETLFKPRGLYCLIMSFRPNVVPKGDVAVEAVDTSKVALKWLNGPSSSFKTNFKNSSGTTNGEHEMPEPAALIYPDVVHTKIRKDQKNDTQSISYSKRKVAAGYFDKRAQAKYAYKHPNSLLACETTHQFASKYGDPTHPSVTTSDIGRLSSRVKHESLEDRQTRDRAKTLVSQSSDSKSSRLRRTVSDLGPVMKAPDLIQNILYLMIVDLPSEKQMEEARGAVELDDA